MTSISGGGGGVGREGHASRLTNLLELIHALNVNVNPQPSTSQRHFGTIVAPNLIINQIAMQTDHLERLVSQLMNPSPLIHT